MRRRHVLILRRGDHKRDALGAIFLGEVTAPEEVQTYVQRYLGTALLVRTVEVEGPALRVTVEAGGFPEESQNLVRVGRGSAGRGAGRVAAETFQEALKLDPLNIDAWKGLARVLAHQGELSGAEEAWVRAGEISGYDGETLRGLATVALRGDRRPTARGYLEEALIVNPGDSEARDLLAELERQTELRFAEPDSPPDDAPRGTTGGVKR
jgi:cytochrome c-type biogenesis protein CcmH/NrfG